MVINNLPFSIDVVMLWHHSRPSRQRPAALEGDVLQEGRATQEAELVQNFLGSWASHQLPCFGHVPANIEAVYHS